MFQSNCLSSRHKQRNREKAIKLNYMKNSGKYFYVSDYFNQYGSYFSKLISSKQNKKLNGMQALNRPTDANCWSQAIASEGGFTEILLHLKLNS